MSKITKDVEKRTGPANTSVYVILDARDNNRVAGKLIYAYGHGQFINVYSGLWDWTNTTGGSRDVQQSHYSGCGEDLKAQAIKGFVFGAGAREFTITKDDMGSIQNEFQEHGYVLQWLL